MLLPRAMPAVINDLLVRLHIVSEPLRFPSSPVLVGVALIAPGGLQGIPQDLSEAAAVDGASRWANLWRIVLPMLATALAVAKATGNFKRGNER